MNNQDEYCKKLMIPQAAIRLISSQANITMGMSVSEPPLLLKALEARIKTSSTDSIQELRVHYMHSEKTSRETIFKYEYMDVVKPHLFFIGQT